MTKFQIGDTVKCVNHMGTGHKFGGSGWDDNKVFKVMKITKYEHRSTSCYWGNSQYGVYEDYLELVKITTPKGGDMKIAEVRVENKSQLKIGLTVRVTRATNGYKKEHLGRVSSMHGSMNAIKIGSVDDQNKKVGDWIHINDIVLVQGQLKGTFSTKTQQFDIRHLDKVILPEGHKKAILETLTQEHANNREILFEQWGFDSVFEKGKGIIFLFWGVPGTGKTLCAEQMALYLKKGHLFMCTSDIQSSVPGQAERNIKKLFEQAKQGKHLLIIDECDSLLYERNNVGMIMAAEINCLLSEIENFDGVCVLTTNRNHKLDPALERRIALKLEFPRPTADLRERIWKTLIPKKCPLDKNVSHKKLAEHNICGGNIKNVIFSAARKTLHENRKKLRMSDFTMSIEREMEGHVAFNTNRGRAVPQKDISTDVVRKGGINVQDKFDV